MGQYKAVPRGMREARLFNILRDYFRQKNRRTEGIAVARLTVASGTMQLEESIDLQQRENKFSLCNKSILSTIGNLRFAMYSLATAKSQIRENAEYNWLKILCTYVQ